MSKVYHLMIHVAGLGSMATFVDDKQTAFRLEQSSIDFVAEFTQRPVSPGEVQLQEIDLPGPPKVSTEV
jgi:hypothetical protein